SRHPRMWRVAGVGADVRQTGFQSPSPLLAYLPAAPSRGMGLSFSLRTSFPAASPARSIRGAVRQVDSDVAVTASRGLHRIVARALSALLYGVGSGDAATYSVSSALILVVAVAAGWLPALRAMRLDPVQTIRCE